jgi:hypothetical protein
MHMDRDVDIDRTSRNQQEREFLAEVRSSHARRDHRHLFFASLVGIALS